MLKTLYVIINSSNISINAFVKITKLAMMNSLNVFFLVGE